MTTYKTLLATGAIAFAMASASITLAEDFYGSDPSIDSLAESNADVIEAFAEGSGRELASQNAGAHPSIDNLSESFVDVDGVEGEATGDVLADDGDIPSIDSLDLGNAQLATRP